jgi:hypothetical protein
MLNRSGKGWGGGESNWERKNKKKTGEEVGRKGGKKQVMKMERNKKGREE